VTGAGRRAAAREEIELTIEELRVAETLLQAGFHRVVLTRAYFAVFHAVRARLYAEGLEPRSHSGVQQLFNQHFVKPGLYDAATSRLMARLQKFREEADYAQAFVVEEAGAREELDAARALVLKIRADLP
jgi:uncharacterized protein (UPF0332 family)